MYLLRANSTGWWYRKDHGTLTWPYKAGRCVHHFPEICTETPGIYFLVIDRFARSGELAEDYTYCKKRTLGVVDGDGTMAKFGEEQYKALKAIRNKCLTTSNKCIASSNKKLLI